MSTLSGFPVLGVVADDLPGAAICATQIRRRGLRTLVTTPHGLAPEHQEAFVTYVDTRERWAMPTRYLDSPARLVENAVRNLIERGCSRIDFRVDPGVRRAYVEEIGGALRGAHFADPPLVIAIPAYPSAGHITHGRSQLSFLTNDGDRNVDAGSRLFGEQPYLLLSTDTIRQGATAIETEIESYVAAGGGHVDDRAANVLAAASKESDLEALSRAVDRLALHYSMLTVSSGAWLKYYPPRINEPVFVLVAVGARTPTTEAQLDVLLEQVDALILSPPEGHSLSIEKERLGNLLSDQRLIVIRGQGADQISELERLEVARTVAESAQMILLATRELGWRCRGVIATGDYTAAAIVKALRVVNILPIADVVPLSPFGMLVGGPWSGLPMAMKPGRAGRVDALVQLFEYLAVGEIGDRRSSGRAAGDDPRGM